MERPGFWRSQQYSSSIFRIIDNNIVELLGKNPFSLPDLRQASTILVTSDYSGEHSYSKYQVFSFLFTTLEGQWQWNKARKRLRAKFLSDNRRMSFKGLNDKQKKKALKPFLEAANNIPGFSFTIGISSSIRSIFEGEFPLDLSNPDFAAFRDWKPKVLEKAFRSVHFMSFILANVSNPGQNVLWFSDEDAIAANTARLRQLTDLASWIISSYITFSLGHIRCGTTWSDDGSKQIEDLAAIPDFIAGALSEQLNLVSEVGPDIPGVFWMHRPDFTQKTSQITWWLTDVKKPLKRVCCLVDPVPNSSSLNVSFIHFHNQC